jgi:membrane-bound serine protease (ClpP class)
MLKRIMLASGAATLSFGFFSMPVRAAMPTESAFDSFISDPNVAYLLAAVAILGLAVEILTPGLIIPGTVGTIAAILAFLGLSELPVNAPGITIFILALPLFIAGAFLARALIPLIIAGVAALLAGSLMLFQGLTVHPALIAAVVVIMSSTIVFVANRAVKAQRLKVITGREGMVCQTAVVRTPLSPEGTVLAEGEIWKARLDHGSAQPGDKVVITCIRGLLLYVTKKEGE